MSTKTDTPAQAARTYTGEQMFTIAGTRGTGAWVGATFPSIGTHTTRGDDVRSATI